MKKLHSLLSVFIISIMLCISAFAQNETYEVHTGTISGQILVKGDGPMKGGTVFFFNKKLGPPPSHNRYWRVPTHGMRVDQNGKFRVALPVGNYYMGASQKLSGEHLGPPLEGDLFFMSKDEKGNPKVHVISKNVNLDLGIIAEAEPFSTKNFVKEGVTSIEGAILDSQGNPVEGIVVFAFTSPVMMGRPLFISGRTDKDGLYVLRFHKGGKYYLRARVNYGGGPPSPDQVMGMYEKPLTIDTGESKKGIDITVTKVGISE